MAIWGVATSFASRIFKKPQTKDGFRKFVNYIIRTPEDSLAQQSYIQKFIKKQPMTAKEKKKCSKAVLQASRNWTKAQKKNLQSACANIRVIAEAKPKPVEVHTLSASYKPQVIEKSRDVHEVVQAGISKIPIYVLVGIGALFILPQLLKTRGGKE